jgi:hypothetical protein
MWRPQFIEVGDNKRTKIYVRLRYIDLRKPVNGMSTIIEAEMNGDPLNGSIFCSAIDQDIC